MKNRIWVRDDDHTHIKVIMCFKNENEIINLLFFFQHKSFKMTAWGLMEISSCNMWLMLFNDTEIRIFSFRKQNYHVNWLVFSFLNRISFTAYNIHILNRPNDCTLSPLNSYIYLKKKKTTLNNEKNYFQSSQHSKS